MTQPAKGQEPSMDESLASIRRIIADEDPTKSRALATAAEPPSCELGAASALPPAAGPPPAARPAVSPHAPPPEQDMPPETEINAMIAQLRATSSRPTPADADDSRRRRSRVTEQQIAPASAFRDQPAVRSEEAPSPAKRAAEQQRQASWEAQRGLVSAATSAAVDLAFNTLAQTVLVDKMPARSKIGCGGRIGPMLKAWLDDNLPSLVERLVRAEIERVRPRQGLISVSLIAKLRIANGAGGYSLFATRFFRRADG